MGLSATSTPPGASEITEGPKGKWKRLDNLAEEGCRVTDAPGRVPSSQGMPWLPLMAAGDIWAVTAPSTPEDAGHTAEHP